MTRTGNICHYLNKAGITPWTFTGTKTYKGTEYPKARKEDSTPSKNAKVKTLSKIAKST